MIDSIADRDLIVRQLREELVGPSPQGQPINCNQPISFDSAKESYAPHRQQDSGEEILQRDPPLSRYGVGVLVPVNAQHAADPIDQIAGGGRDLSEDLASDRSLESAAVEGAAEIQERASRQARDADDDNLDISTANSFRASSMAVTFLAELPPESFLVVEATGGRYRKIDVLIEGKTRGWYLRSPVRLLARIPARMLQVNRVTRVSPPPRLVEGENTAGLNLRFEVLARPRSVPNTSLLTVSLQNRTAPHGTQDELCLFQSHLSSYVQAPDNAPHILPYPTTPNEKLDEEEQSLALLYRSVQTFAVGHGCAADWKAADGATRADAVIGECLPAFETPSITPEIKVDGTPLEVSMAALGGLIEGDDGLSSLTRVVELYGQWIKEQREQIATLEDRYEDAATRHVDDCTRCLERMRRGLQYLQDPQVLRAFRLANQAILLQQICTRRNREPRRVQYDEKQNRISFDKPFVTIDPMSPMPGVGYWRPFQIAFLLLAIESSTVPNHPDRETVELIWFPTGGGKTEAYLGLTAFSLFMRRLRDPDDVGVSTLMRYTLRLLTAQQFQRASGLIVAMETLRKKHLTELGLEPFSIGIWLGSATTPNTRQDARDTLRDLQKGDRYADNKLLLRQCPWCGAQMGPLEQKGRGGANRQVPVPGYKRSGDTVAFHCPDPACDFYQSLPILVIDEDIYEKRPSLVIGTVDKFAMLAWVPEARALFGLDTQGKRICSPPGLIIQDELHLISGPLGSLVGLFEGLIERLCSDERRSSPVLPKIISSTATIRRYREQIRALFARESVELFPPPGLGADNSFFARFARSDDGILQPGRMYVGIHAPGLGSQLTALVRSFSALLQAGNSLDRPSVQSTVN